MEFDPQAFALAAERPVDVEADLPSARETSVEVRLTASDKAPTTRPIASISAGAETLCGAMASSLLRCAWLAAEERGLSDGIDAITCIVTGTHGPAPAFRIRRFRTAVLIDGTLAERDKARIILAAGAAGIEASQGGRT